MPYRQILFGIVAVLFFARGARIEEEPPLLWASLSAGTSLFVLLLGGGNLAFLGGQILVYAAMFTKKLVKDRKRERDGI